MEIHDDLPDTIRGDQAKLMQILYHLLSNAVKFTPEGGQVGLEVSGDETLRIVHITVWDTGIGIARKDMEQLFFALVDNAIMAADQKSDQQLTISGSTKNDYIELKFSDNCSGITHENIDKVFQPFFTTKDESQGTGLGLSVVQLIASQMKGKVWVESVAGKGSTFFVTLPINGSTN